jgi:hypothetical protein
MRSVSGAEIKSNGFLAFNVDQGEDYVGLSDLRQQIDTSRWIVLPSTPCTNYSGGIRLSKGLGSAFLLHLKRMIPHHASSLRLLGLVHSGRDEDGSVIVEASMLHNRFRLETDQHTSVVGYLSRLLYEAILLPRLVQQPNHLLYALNGTVERKDGLPLYEDNTVAGHIEPREVDHLLPLRFLAHSSGVVTMQQMDNAMRHDMELLGYSSKVQSQLFNRSVFVSFGSAADINSSVSGTPTVDVTVYNDIRSMAGTTTLDYLSDDEHRRKQSVAAQDKDYRYDASKWKLICGTAGKMVLRRIGVFLREDPLRQHDGHSIRRYLEGVPEAVATLLKELHSSFVDVNFDVILKQQAMAATVIKGAEGKNGVDAEDEIRESWGDAAHYACYSVLSENLSLDDI